MDMRRFAILFLALIPMLTVGTELLLVKDSTPNAVIHLPEPSTRSAQLGALELQHHIRLITGATLPIVKGGDAPTADVLIRIQGTAPNEQGECSRIHFDGQTIVISGNDTQDFKEVDYQKPGTFPPTDYHWKGSLFAVYDFLEEYCGVRWYGQRELDTTFTPRATLAVSAREHQFVSPLDGQRMVYDDERAYHIRPKSELASYRDFILWRLRWRSSLTFGAGGHNTMGIYFAHWGKAASPELAPAFRFKDESMFAQGYKGANACPNKILLENYPGDQDLPPNICYSSEAAINYYVQEALTYYNGGNVLGGHQNPRGKIPVDRPLLPRFPGKPWFYPYNPNDVESFCLCEACRRLSPTNQNFANAKYSFVSEVARRLSKVAPGTGMRTSAYIGCMAYPDGIDLADNLCVGMCFFTPSWWHPVARRLNDEIFDEWVTKGKGKITLGVTTYIFGSHWDAKYHFGNYKPFPALCPWKYGEFMKRYFQPQNGVRLWFSEMLPLTYPLECYLCARLAYDPSLDASAIIDEYFRNYYGAAGEPMREFYRLVESAVFNTQNLPKEWLESKNVVLSHGGPKHPYWPTGVMSREVNWTMGSHALMAQLEDLRKRAQELADSEVVRQRLNEFDRLVWNVAREGRREHDLYLARRDNPLPSMSVAPLAEELGGDPAKVAWTDIPKSGKWLDHNGHDNGSTASVQLAGDAKYLYIRFHEDEGPALDLGFWKHNIEFFFTPPDRRHPLCQYAFSPTGATAAFKYDIVNDTMHSDKFDFHEKAVNAHDEGSWTVLLAFPWDSLPIKEGRLNAEFARHKSAVPPNTPNRSAFWSPPYGSARDSADNYGTIYRWPAVLQQECFGQGKSTKIVDDPAAADGKAMRVAAHVPWKLKCPVPQSFPADKVRVILRYRVESEPAQYVAFNIYEPKTKQTILKHKEPFEKVVGKEYHDVVLGEAVLKTGMVIHVGGIYADPKNYLKSNQNVHYLDFVRFELAR